MIASDTSHALGPDLALLAPPSFAIRPSAQGLVGSESGSGAVLSVLLKSTAAGSLSPERLIGSALALLQKKHASAQPMGATESIKVQACEGRTALLQAVTPGSAPIHIVLTAIIVPDPANAAQQRNLIVVLEVPAAAFEQRREYYLRFAQQQLRIGAAKSAPLVLELAPMDVEVKPEVAVAPIAAPATVRVIPEIPPQPAGVQARAPAVAAAAGTPSDEDELLASAAQGQRTLAISILLSFVARAIGNVPDVPVFLAYAIAAAVLIYAISGVLKICSGFAYSMNTKLALMFCSSVPLLGICTWVYLSIKTTRRLRAAGYQVGLLGART